MQFSLPACSLLFIILSFINDEVTGNKNVYTNQYDLKAREAVFLCKQMTKYLKTGTEPVRNLKEMRMMPTSEFIHPNKNDECWEFKWNSCEGHQFDHDNNLPCGYYEMKKSEHPQHCSPSNKDAK